MQVTSQNNNSTDSSTVTKPGGLGLVQVRVNNFLSENSAAETENESVHKHKKLKDKLEVAMEDGPLPGIPESTAYQSIAKRKQMVIQDIERSKQRFEKKNKLQ